jgi:predicted 3-demethylubiquinone-9 3-methyltransferase (glyoxalase superfamily)
MELGQQALAREMSFNPVIEGGQAMKRKNSWIGRGGLVLVLILGLLTACEKDEDTGGDKGLKCNGPWRKLVDDVSLTLTGLRNDSPYLVWTGSEYGLVWNDYSGGLSGEVSFAPLPAEGSGIQGLPLTDPDGTDSTDSLNPSLAWTGIGYGVSWQDERDGNSEIYFARISTAFAKIGADVRLSNDSGQSRNPSLVWTGTEFGLVWQDDRSGNDEIYFTRLNTAGVEIGTAVQITNAGGESQDPSLVWTGSLYGVSWTDERDGNAELYFTQISAEGEKIGEDVRMTNDPGLSEQSSLVWAQREYGVSWQDDRDGLGDEIYFARISAQGQKLGSDVRITEDPNLSEAPSLAWSGSHYGVSWQDDRDGLGNEIYFARISPSGHKLDHDLRVTLDLAASAFSSLAWTGTEFGLSWSDTRGGNDYEIYFTRIGCYSEEVK